MEICNKGEIGTCMRIASRNKTAVDLKIGVLRDIKECVFVFINLKCFYDI